MKKVLFLMFLLFLMILGTASVNAQVNIGKDAVPHSGAILDLSQGERELGLLLPNVALADVNVLQVVDAAAGDIATQKASARGMVVYNTNTSTTGGNGAGLYSWDGSRWRVLAVDGGAMTTSPAVLPTVPETGGKTGEITVTSPAVDGFSGDYTFVVISGGEYAEVNPASSSEGKFEVSFQPNTSALVRRAVVLVIDPVGNTSTFIFTQDANASLCANGGSHDPIVTQTGTLGSGGAVYFSITAEANTDYVWTRNGAIVATDTTYIATQPGNYIVYGGGIGCTHKYSVTLTSAGTSPAPVVSVISSNGGIICGSSSVTLTALGVPTGANLAWFKDGVLLPQETASIITVNAPGNYFVAVKNGNLYSVPSNISTVVSGGGGSQVSLNEDDVKVNGTPINSFNSYCKGGSLYLTVDNKQAGYTYTWYNGNGVITATNPYIIPATQNNILLRLVVTDASGALCPAETNSTEKSITSTAPAPATISGDNQVCSGQSINLVAVGAENADSYQWYRDEALIPGNTATLSINVAGSYRVRYSQAGGCTSDLSAPFAVSALGAPAIDWNQFVAEVNDASTYTFSVRSTGSSAPTAYSWSAVPSGVTILEVNGVASSNLSSISGNTVNLKFTGIGSINLLVAPINSCGTGSQVSKVVSMIITNLPAPTITSSSGTFCGGVNFRIAKPAGWTSQQWSAFSLANITAATLSGSAYPGTLTSDGTYYYYYIAASSSVAQTASLSVGGQIGALPITPVTASATIQAQSTQSSFTVGGINCFDINFSNLSTRTKADFAQSYTYSLSGTLDNEIISSVAWTYTNPKNAVQVFTPAATSGIVTANQVTVKYDPALLNDATIGTGGILVVLTATITTTGGTCPNAVYKAEIPVRIKDAICCPGVLIPGGVHTGPEAKDIQDHTIYDNLGEYEFSREANKDLCVYYRDASSNQTWQAAFDGCANATAENIDAAHKDFGWRLPNIAELGQMHTTGASSATWSPKYDQLSTISSSVPTVYNMQTDTYWSVTKITSANYPIYWKYNDQGTWWTSATSVGRYVRCVRTMD